MALATSPEWMLTVARPSAWPSACTTRVYRPGGSSGKEKRPLASLVSFQSRSRTVTVALATGKMASSTTTPETAPRMSSGLGCSELGRSRGMRSPLPRRTVPAVDLPPHPAKSSAARTAAAIHPRTAASRRPPRLELCRTGVVRLMRPSGSWVPGDERPPGGGRGVVEGGHEDAEADVELGRRPGHRVRLDVQVGWRQVRRPDLQAGRVRHAVADAAQPGRALVAHPEPELVLLAGGGMVVGGLEDDVRQAGAPDVGVEVAVVAGPGAAGQPAVGDVGEAAPLLRLVVRQRGRDRREHDPGAGDAVADVEGGGRVDEAGLGGREEVGPRLQAGEDEGAVARALGGQVDVGQAHARAGDGPDGLVDRSEE